MPGGQGTSPWETCCVLPRALLRGVGLARSLPPPGGLSSITYVSLVPPQQICPQHPQCAGSWGHAKELECEQVKFPQEACAIWEEGLLLEKSAVGMKGLKSIALRG